MRKLTLLLLTLLLVVGSALPVIAAETKLVDPAKAELLDINSASEAQLKSLPGIGDTYAKKIIAGRPYAKKDQLKSKAILPAATYAKIQDRIIASQQSK